MVPKTEDLSVAFGEDADDLRGTRVGIVVQA